MTSPKPVKKPATVSLPKAIVITPYKRYTSNPIIDTKKYPTRNILSPELNATLQAAVKSDIFFCSSAAFRSEVVPVFEIGLVVSSGFSHSPQCKHFKAPSSISSSQKGQFILILFGSTMSKLNIHCNTHNSVFTMHNNIKNLWR